MGRVVLFNRRIDLADDDMYLPAFYYIIHHSIWALVIFGVYMLTQSDCVFKGDMHLYLLLLMGNLALTIPLELFVLILSLSGSVSKHGKRWLISPLCHVHILFSVAEMSIHCYGMSVAFGPRKESNGELCTAKELPPSVVWVHTIIIWGFIVALIGLTFVGLVMYASKARHITDMLHYQQVWKQRLEWVMSGLKNNLAGADVVMGEVAAELADYFRDVEWAPSDFLVGLLLMEKDQAHKKQILQERRRLHFVDRLKKQQDMIKRKNSERESKDPRHRNIHRLNHELEHEPLDIALDPVWRTAKEYQPLQPTRSNSINRPKSQIQRRYGYDAMTKEDISDILYFASYAEVAYIKEACEEKCGDNLLYFSEENDLFKSPYFIAVDERYSSLVISIRGTYSAADWLVDLKIDLEPFYVNEIGKKGLQWTHSGIHQTAANILREFRVKGTLNKLLGEDSPYHNFNVIVTGHSLGAGVAALLAYMLRRDGYMNTSCYAYSPPGQLLTEAAAKVFEPFCISIVAGDDFVCRLSRNSMQILKMDMKRLLEECDMPKYKVLGSFIGSSFLWWKKEKKPTRPRIQSSSLSRYARVSQCNGQIKVDEASEHHQQSSRWSIWIKQSFSPVLKRELEKGMSKIKDIINDCLHDEDDEESQSLLPHPPMFLPGRILYIEKCQLFHDDKDIDLPWTHSRHSILNPPAAVQTSSKVIAPTSSTIMDMDSIMEKSSETQSDGYIPVSQEQGRFSYTPRWASREEFQEITISATMLKDHFPFPILSELSAIPMDRKLRHVTK